MTIEKAIKKYRKILESEGFTYEWFPNEYSFKKENIVVCIFTDEENFQAVLYKYICSPDEISFSFDKIKFKNQEKNDNIYLIFKEKDKCKRLEMTFDFVLNNFDWLRNLTTEDIDIRI